MNNFSQTLQDSLWEFDKKNMNYESENLIIRAFMFWEIQDIKLIESKITRKKIIEIFQKNLSQIDVKSQNFWNIYFNLKSLKNKPLSLYEQLNFPTFQRSFR
jgi:hypothetical protein